MTDVVFLVDFDNTLFDHDTFKLRIGAWLESHDRGQGEAPFWRLYEEIRDTTGIVDIPLTVDRYAWAHADEPFGREFAAFIWEFPYRCLAFGGAHEAVAHLGSLGRAVVLCDGSAEHQRHKIAAAGFADLVGGRILVFDHKEEHIEAIRAAHPADHYVILDDKPRIHAAFKAALGPSVTTVHVRQGHYAATPGELRADSRPDVVVQSIAEVQRALKEHAQRGR